MDNWSCMPTVTDATTLRWCRWLHRIGYVTTALILAQMLVVGFLLSREWLRKRDMRAALVEESRTHETPLLPSSERYERRNAIEVLKTLPPLTSLNSDGVRFAAMPSFGTYYYAIAISLPPTRLNAEGILKAFDLRSSRLVSQREFAVPREAYKSLVHAMDTMTDDWPGDTDLCVDGSPMPFERVRGRRVTSGVGNCSEHYARLELLVLTYVRRFAPGPDLPTENDWHREAK
jgi:hypothetical protein